MKNELQSIKDLTLSNLFIDNDLQKYDVQFKSDAKVGRIIYEHLTSKPGFIRHKRSAVRDVSETDPYLESINKAVSKGSPLEIFFMSFSPKVKSPHVTNGQLLPDMADFLSLIHLHLLAKGIREIYDYGFRFIVGYKGRLYQPFCKWPQGVPEQTFSILQLLNAEAERIVGVRNVVELVDAQTLVDELGEGFQDNLRAETLAVKKEYESQNDFYTRKIDAWCKDFRKSLDLRDFSSISEVDDYLLRHAFRYRALKNIEYSGGKDNLGIITRFPNVLRGTIRGADEKISIQINPFFDFHSHQRLIALTNKKQWNTMRWQEMVDLNSAFPPVFLKEFSYPFYFHEI